ncbi:hypothetical protein KSP39_PZI005792 [Platanthera zijinensis]|uniref:Uncharacterized protein n=1 Tax=Platanthera zijinensis TaxID=2320716 RepID=A0AAP0BT19_9ASPA
MHYSAHIICLHEEMLTSGQHENCERDDCKCNKLEARSGILMGWHTNWIFFIVCLFIESMSRPIHSIRMTDQLALCHFIVQAHSLFCTFLSLIHVCHCSNDATSFQNLFH